MPPPSKTRVRSAPIASGVGARLALAMKRLGFTNASLAARTAARGEVVSVDTVRKMQGGRDRRVEVETVRRLALALGCRPGWLAFAEGEAPPDPNEPVTTPAPTPVTP